MKEIKVKLVNVSKSYPMYGKQSERLFDLLSIKKNKSKKVFYALEDISFEVYAGDTVGIIGLNGSGKSTLSNLIAQIIQQSSGEVHINGETSLIAISAGLDNNLTGLENIDLKCMMHGLTKEEIGKIKNEIIDFADVGDHINQPVKNYSSGMRSKLGFAIAVNIDPDILVIDEALSVGDSTFAEKSLKKMKEFKEKGKTIFFISHSVTQVKNFCEKAIWINYGKLVDYGDVDSVIKRYKKYINNFNELDEDSKKKLKQDERSKQIFEVKTEREKSKKRIKPLLNSVINMLILSPVLIFGSLILLGY